MGEVICLASLIYFFNRNEQIYKIIVCYTTIGYYYLTSILLTKH